MDDTKERVSSRHSMTEALISSQRLWQHSHCTDPNQMGSQCWDGEIEMSSYLYPKSYLQLTTTTKKGESHFSREVSLVIQTTKQQAPMPNSRWPIWNKLKGIVGDFFFFGLSCLLLVYSGFQFWVFMDFVCVCLHICVFLVFFLSFFFSLFLFICLFILLYPCLFDFLKRERKHRVGKVARWGRSGRW